RFVHFHRTREPDLGDAAQYSTSRLADCLGEDDWQPVCVPSRVRNSDAAMVAACSLWTLADRRRIQGDAGDSGHRKLFLRNRRALFVDCPVFDASDVYVAIPVDVIDGCVPYPAGDPDAGRDAEGRADCL